ncbi:GTP cyclohydrolase 1 type 2 [Buchnera aphidicola (Neophyllaphis podocarpi)]|uniref:Nif3-like dinuclear metal center hexameric protein n=1 Tax=Buchnera aphidicola TaxID=9 RepID=UPI003464AB91
MNNKKLEKIINKKLNSSDFKDFTPNGLQIEGEYYIKKIVTGVTACKELIDQAINIKANTIIVHHGYFWNNEKQIITGMKRLRLKSILSNNINLYSWHLPLDMNLKLGNNIKIAEQLGIKFKKCIMNKIFIGEFEKNITAQELREKIKQIYNRKPIYCGYKRPMSNIKNLAWCSGAGQKYINLAIEIGADAFITGEISEQTMHYAKENKIHFFSAGHHATEIEGIKSLGNWLVKKYKLDIKFINIYNPA